MTSASVWRSLGVPRWSHSPRCGRTRGDHWSGTSHGQRPRRSRTLAFEAGSLRSEATPATQVCAGLVAVAVTHSGTERGAIAAGGGGTDASRMYGNFAEWCSGRYASSRARDMGPMWRYLRHVRTPRSGCPPAKRLLRVVRADIRPERRSQRAKFVRARTGTGRRAARSGPADTRRRHDRMQVSKGRSNHLTGFETSHLRFNESLILLFEDAERYRPDVDLIAVPASDLGGFVDGGRGFTPRHHCLARQRIVRVDEPVDAELIHAGRLLVHSADDVGKLAVAVLGHEQPDDNADVLSISKTQHVG